MPSNVACCASGDAAMLGYAGVMEGAAAVFLEHWPGRVWLGDAVAEEAEEVAGEAGSDDDAVEALRAALGSLAPAGNGGAGSAALGRVASDGGSGDGAK